MKRALVATFCASCVMLVWSLTRSTPRERAIPEEVPSAPAFSLTLPVEPAEGLTKLSAATRTSGLPAAPVSSGPPAMMHLDAHHTNRSPFKAPRSPKLAWTLDLGAPMVVAPVVADGGVIVATLRGKIASVSPTGTTRWSLSVGDRIYGSPLVHNGTVFIGVDTPPKPAKQGRLLLLNATTGAVKSKLEIDGDVDTAIAPLADNAGIVFSAGRTLVAARHDGTVMWRYKARRKISGAAAISIDGSIVAGSQDDSIFCVSKTGDLVWQTMLGSDVDAAPAIGDDGTIFVGTDAGELVALRHKDGSILWRKQLGGFIRGPLSIARDGTVLASTYGPVPAVVALSPNDGSELWRFNIRGTGAKEFGIHGAPLEDATGALVFGAQDDHLYALDPDGRLLWKQLVGGDVDATVILSEDARLYAASDDGKLYAFDDQQ
ncbi:MAG: PQQ-binding-like beta-propeller repeat protein [Polyangiaceae bacterium]